MTTACIHLNTNTFFIVMPCLHLHCGQLIKRGTKGIVGDLQKGCLQPSTTCIHFKTTALFHIVPLPSSLLWVNLQNEVQKRSSVTSRMGTNEPLQHPFILVVHTPLFTYLFIFFILLPSLHFLCGQAYKTRPKSVPRDLQRGYL